MESVSTFVDTQNAVLMLKAPEGATGAVDVTVTVQNSSGTSTSQTFRVNVIPDTINSPPFLADIPEITTPIDTDVTYQLVAIDTEGDPAFYLDQQSMSANGLPIPVSAPLSMQYTVDFDTGLLTVSPRNGISGVQRISVATAVSPNAVDYQVVRVVVGAGSGCADLNSVPRVRGTKVSIFDATITRNGRAMSQSPAKWRARTSTALVTARSVLGSSASMLPQLGRGSPTPRPTNDNVTSASM